MKTKVIRITIDLILIVLGIIFLVFGIKEAISTFSVPQYEDSIRFSKNYTNVTRNNNYKYIENINDVKDNGIIFVGNPKDAWSQVLASVLETILKDKTNEIYYYEGEIENVPQIIIIDNEEKTIYQKSDLIEKDYEEAPIFYWTESRLEQLSKIFNK